jgi:hypothetical protein
MAHYAYLDENNIVTQIIVGKDENEDGVNWEEYYGAVRTSYNTHGGQHPNGTPFRMNYAGIGYFYDPDFGTEGAFIPPQPYPSWTLNSETALWDAPIPMPEEGFWRWDEDTLSWIEVPDFIV